MVERKTTEEVLGEINKINNVSLRINDFDEWMKIKYKVWLSEDSVKEALARVSERSEAEAESNGHESAVAQLQEELFGVDEE